VIDANIDNIEKQEDSLVITVPLENFNQAREILEKNKIEMISADTEYIIKTKADVDNETIEKVAKLVEKLEELDDVQDVYANVDLPE
ncbi:MAG TPA: YebC/PmpR family DNA-binding transcriptional regulator, partial [bacterium]|nr:YebC/PmpR family DNA-binding transcriptional regulator [bacterium]